MKSDAANLGCGIPPRLAAFYLQHLLEIQFIFFEINPVCPFGHDENDGVGKINPIRMIIAGMDA